MKTVMLMMGLVLIAQGVAVADWPQWRGPGFDGEAKAEGLPVEFGPDHHLAWSVKLPGPGAATPVVAEGRVFVSTTGPNQSLWAMAFDLNSGKELWTRKVSQGKPISGRSSLATPSPVTDGKDVWFFFGDGTLARFSAAGARRWSRNLHDELGTFAIIFGYSVSPMLHDGKLYMPVLQRDEKVRGRGSDGGKSFLLILNAANGKTLHQATRPTKARQESMEAYTTAMPMTVGDGHQIIVAGADVLTGHDAKTGQELWRWGNYNLRNVRNHRLVTSPVVLGEHIVLCEPRGGVVFAITADGAKVAWKNDQRDIGTDVATPAVAQGDVFVLNGEKQMIARLDGKNGNVKWNTPIRGNLLRASPAVADGKVYCINHNADVFVLDAATGKLLATNRLDDGSTQARASIVVTNNRLLIRTDTHLYCFSAK